LATGFFAAVSFVCFSPAIASGDPATGEFGDAKLVRKFGDMLGDLSAL
jgi:hypothetical protein